MLEQMRNTTGSLLIWVLFAIIIAAFVLFFGSPSDSLGCGTTDDYSIQVEKEPVSVHSWRFAYNGMPMIFGNVPGNQRRPMALEFLLQREILAQAAEKLDFKVSEALVDEAIRTGDFYLLGNKMDGTQIYFENSEDEGFFFEYQYLENLVKGRLGLPGMQVYRNEQRREMLAYFMKQELMQSAYVSEEEARDTFIRANTTVSAKYVKFEVGRYRAGLKLSEAEVKDYADTHADELAKEWEQVKARWEGDEARLQARIIKITKKPSPPASEEEGEKPVNPADLGKTVIDAARARIEGGESFAEVAIDVSEDRTASLGGLIGWRAADSMGFGQEVVDASKDLEVGKVSPVIENSLFYYLVLVEKRSDKGLTLEDKILDLAAKAAPEETARKRAKAAAEAALASAQTTPLDELFKSAAPSGIPDLEGLSPEVREQLRQQLTPEQLEKLMKGMVPGSQGGAIVVEGRTRYAQQGGAPEVPKAPAAASDPTPTVKPAPAKPVAAKPVAAKPASPKPATPKPATPPVVTATTTPPPVGAPPVDGAGPQPPGLETIVGTTRNGDFIAGLGRSKELVSDIFGDLAAGALAPRVYEVSESDGYVVIQLTDRTEADMEQFKEEAASLQATLSQAKGFERLQSWLLKSCLSLKEAGAIKTNYSLLVAGSDRKQIPYEPCSSLEGSP
jgi:hypothetical protein